MSQYIALYIILYVNNYRRAMFARDIFISSDLLVIASLLISDTHERLITIL